MQFILIFPVCLLLQHANTLRAESVPADKHELLMQSEEPGSGGGHYSKGPCLVHKWEGSEKGSGNSRTRI